ncbi:MAG: aminopeptidase P family protein [Anaerolineaceae bacterium]|nr:aminopeptidase P family protein [Anaerolineaceae bacterium]
MKKDLDRLMKEQNLNALWVMGGLQNNPDMVYFTGIHHVNRADLFKLRGRDPILYHFVDMEREEAVKSNIETHSYFSNKPFSKYLQENKGNLPASIAARMKEAIDEIGGISGRVAISGIVDLSYAYALVEQLKRILPKIEFVSLLKENVIMQARMTKSTQEIEHIRKMGKITTKVVSHVYSFLQGQDVFDNHLIFPDGTPITIKDVKNRIQLWLAKLGADNPEDTIFAIGRDGGIPHSSGSPDDLIELGKPIVFDIFPCETGGGYFYDFTRTWCLGYASDEVSLLHQQVLDVHNQIIDELRVGEHFKTYQERTCQLFAKMGHITIAQKSNISEGYLHSVGHGLGLNVHEKPFSGITAAPDDILIPGVVFTIEPGLYYPKKGMGVRIEDTLFLGENGQFEILADYPYDLVIPLK